MACFRKLYTPLVPHEKGDAEIGLQMLDLLAERGLCGFESFRGPRELNSSATATIPQVPQFHMLTILVSSDAGRLSLRFCCYWAGLLSIPMLTLMPDVRITDDFDPLAPETLTSAHEEYSV